MNECSLIPTLPIEVWQSMGRLIVDSSSKKKLNDHITNFVTAFLCNFIEDLETKENRKAFVTDANKVLLQYSLKARKISFLDLNLSREDAIAFLKEHKASLGTEDFEIPLYSLDEVQDLSTQSGLTAISLKGEIELSDVNKLLGLPHIKKVQLKGFFDDLTKIELKKIGASELSINIFGWGNPFSIEDLETFNIKTLDMGTDVEFEESQINAIDDKDRVTFPHLKKIQFRGRFDSFINGYYRNSGVKKLAFRAPAFCERFFEELKALKNLSSLKLKGYRPVQGRVFTERELCTKALRDISSPFGKEFNESNLSELPLNLRKLTLISFRFVDTPEYFNLATHLKVLNLSGCTIFDLKFLKPTLKTLTLSFDNLLWRTFEAALPELNLKHLTLLSLNMPEHFFEALESKTKLRSLGLEKSRNVDLEKLSIFLKKIPLRHLSLRKSELVGNFKNAFEGQRLQSLNISKTCVIIRDLSLAFLKELTINTDDRLPKEYITIKSNENREFLKGIKGLRVVHQNKTSLRLQNPNV